MERLWRPRTRPAWHATGRPAPAPSSSPSTSPSSCVSAADLRAFDTAGFVVLKGAVPPDLLGKVRYVLERWEGNELAKWVAEGKLEPSTAPGAAAWQVLPFESRLVSLWDQAGRPSYSRSPRRDLVCSEMYGIHTHPALTSVAAALCNVDLGGGEALMSHPVFNGRSKLPAQIWTDTPWHQDA